MPEYFYIARDRKQGVRVEGRLSASTKDAALADLESLDLVPVQVNEVAQVIRIRRMVSTRELGRLYIQLSDLLRAGVPLLRSLEILYRSRKKNFFMANVLQEIKQSVADGERLGDAMSSHPDCFSSIQTSMVLAGEQGGFLEPVLRRIGFMLQRQEELKSSVLTAMIYPAILLLAGLSIILYALVYFVPQFENYFETIQVPLSTQVLLNVSSFIRGEWHWIFFFIGLSIFLFRVVIKYHSAAHVWTKLKMGVPLLGNLWSLISIARFSRILGTLLSNSIPVLDALKISCETVHHPVLKKSVIRAQEIVRDGGGLADPLSDSGIIEDNFIEIIRVGEEANNLSGVLTDLAEALEKQVDVQLSIAARLLEPLMLILMGLVVIFIFFSLLGPMLEIANTI